MDTSTTLDTAEQLHAIAAKISPLMDIFPFKRLGDYLQTFQMQIDGRGFYFDFGGTVAPLGMRHNDMVIMVPVTEKVSRNPDGSFDFLKVVNLVFVKCTSDIGYWNIHHAKFDRQDYPTIPNQRRSSQSTIIECGSLSQFRAELSGFNLPVDLVEKVCTSLQILIRESVKKRRMILAQLEALSAELQEIKNLP